MVNVSDPEVNIVQSVQPMIFDEPEYLDPLKNQFPADINAVSRKISRFTQIFLYYLMKFIKYFCF